MKKKIQELWHFTERVGAAHVGAYAAQSAYFLMLSLIFTDLVI